MLDFIINPIAGGKGGKKTKKVVSILEQILLEKKVDFCFHQASYEGYLHETEFSSTFYPSWIVRDYRIQHVDRPVAI